MSSVFGTSGFSVCRPAATRGLAGARGALRLSATGPAKPRGAAACGRLEDVQKVLTGTG
jgi:hypothetical protein